MLRPTIIRPDTDISNRMTVGEFLTTWHAANEHHNRFLFQESPAETRTRITRDIIPMIGNIPIDELEGRRMIQPAVNLDNEGAQADATAVQNTLLTALHAAGRLGLGSPRLENDVCLTGTIQLWESGWRFDDFLRMVFQGGREDAFDALQLMWATDLEPHEIVALRWSDLDRRRLRVRHTLGLENEKPTLMTATPLSGERVIRLDYVEDELFNTHRLLQDRGPEVGDGTLDQRPIFPNPNGDFQTPSALQEAINKHTDRVDAPRISLTYIRYLLPMLRTFPAILGDEPAKFGDDHLDGQRLAA